MLQKAEVAYFAVACERITTVQTRVECQMKRQLDNFVHLRWVVQECGFFVAPGDYGCDCDAGDDSCVRQSSKHYRQ